MTADFTDGRVPGLPRKPIAPATYRGWSVDYDPKPIPIRDFDWTASHPDCDAYFSKRDLEHSCPWFSYVVLSIKSGRLDHANSYRPDFDQTVANKEELVYG